MRDARAGTALLLMAGVAAALVLCEGGVRLLGAGSPRPTGYAPVNTQLAVNRHENARGYRDFERPLAKPPGVRRVLCLGDSFTWGVGVLFEDAYPHRLERALVERRHQAWEVVNLSLRGMSSVDEATKLEDEGLDYDPDAVLVGYCLNDAEDEGSAEARRARDWAERASRGPTLLDRSALYRLVRTRIEATLENHRRIAGFHAMYAEGASGWIAGRQALKKMGALCRAKGVPLVVVIFPLFGNPLDDSYPFEDVHLKVAQAAEAAGARVIDLLPKYRGLRWEILVVDGGSDEHPNEIAHRIAANAIARGIDDLLPR